MQRVLVSTKFMPPEFPAGSRIIDGSGVLDSTEERVSSLQRTGNIATFTASLAASFAMSKLLGGLYHGDSLQLAQCGIGVVIAAPAIVGATLALKSAQQYVAEAVSKGRASAHIVCEKSAAMMASVAGVFTALGVDQIMTPGDVHRLGAVVSGVAAGVAVMIGAKYVRDSQAARTTGDIHIVR